MDKNSTKLILLGVGLLAACLAGMAPAASAQTAAITYNLDDVWLLPGNFHGLGLDNTATLGVVLTADANGAATWNTNVPAGACGNIYLQAINHVTSCGLSEVVLLQ